MSVESDLSRDTNRWTLPVVIRAFDNDDKGRKRLQEEAAVLSLRGYVPQTQSQDDGHLHAGRLLVSGGLSALAGQGGIRSKGQLSMTFIRAASASKPVLGFDDAMAQLRRLNAMRDAGVITAEEFEARKTEIVAQL